MFNWLILLFCTFLFSPYFVTDYKLINIQEDLNSGESNIPVISTDMHGLWSPL